MTTECFAHVLFFGRCALCGANEIAIIGGRADCLPLAPRGPRAIARFSLLEAISGEDHEMVDRIAPAVDSLDYELLGYRPLMLLVHRGSMERIQRVVALAHMGAEGCGEELVLALTSGRLAIANCLWEAGARCTLSQLANWFEALDRDALLRLQRSGVADFLTSRDILPNFSIDGLADAYRLRLARLEHQRLRRVLDLTRQRITGGITLVAYIKRIKAVGGVWRQRKSWDWGRRVMDEYDDDDWLDAAGDMIEIVIGSGDGVECTRCLYATDDVRSGLRELLEAFAERLVAVLHRSEMNVRGSDAVPPGV